jgi:glycosyltransferase involved in cell wall biosynthesis
MPPAISIAIPCHQMDNREAFLRRNLAAIEAQTFRDCEVVISDTSDDMLLKHVCDEFQLPIRWFRSHEMGVARNTNSAMRASTGQIIKFVYLDDYLAHKDALEDIYQNFTRDWLVTGCNVDPGTGPQGMVMPSIAQDIRFGNNTIGAPSVMAIRNENLLFFDENLSWLVDCDYYHRMVQRFGPPVFLHSINVTIGLGPHQLSQHLSQAQKEDDFKYVRNLSRNDER